MYKTISKRPETANGEIQQRRNPQTTPRSPIAGVCFLPGASKTKGTIIYRRVFWAA